LPDFELTGIIFYIFGIQWLQREIFPSLVLTHHGIFASRRQAAKMHLLDDEAMTAASIWLSHRKHLPCRKS
jgi:hypothetical protein